MTDPPKEITLGGMEFIHIPGGLFEMGDVFGDGADNEKPAHTVELDTFYLGKYQVTFDQYDAFCEATGKEKPGDAGWGRCRRPVINVNWEDAKAFCEWMSDETGEKIRLPTEAEWEYAARECGKKMKWAGTNEENRLKDYAWFWDNSDHKTHAVGEKKPNGLGLSDMSGNVREWCADWYDIDYYKSSPSNNPQASIISGVRVTRGGCLYNSPWFIRCTCRGAGNQRRGSDFDGFRCVRTLKGK